MTRRLPPLVMFLLALVVLGCSTGRGEPPERGGGEERAAAAAAAPDVLTSEALAATAKTFDAYWSQGLAELSRFELVQQRYGEAHAGEHIAIFVTEPFLRDAQVKHEFGPGEQAVNVLKLHSHRRFDTGIYPYNVHTSAFVPLVRDEGALKVSFSATEWCGVVYAQLNRREESGFRVRSHSYFQAEGDEDFELSAGLLEDELWVWLRRDPDQLPVGELEVVPGLTYLRLLHKEIKPWRAVAERLSPAKTEFYAAPLASYRVTYPELGRALTLYYEPSFPFRIHGFREAHAGLSGGEVAETVGRVTHSIMLDYWAKHGAGDAGYRQALGLSP